MSNAKEEVLLVDAHVHIYNCFDVNTLFDAAFQNFMLAAKKMGHENKFTGVLMLSETSADFWFKDTREKCLQNKSSSEPGNRWKLEATSDKSVLLAQKNSRDSGDTKSLYIMAGRQIITAEGLELLALATDNEFKDGLSVSSALGLIREHDAIPVFPWAVGKWLGNRGKILSEILDTEANTDLCLGDNSGRPVFWHNPSHFKKAQQKKMLLLPGSDPLPLFGEASKVGSFGFMIRGKLSKTNSSSELKSLLRDKTTQAMAYGRLEMPFRFIVNQIKLRLG